jgi:hypothetical protein
LLRPPTKFCRFITAPVFRLRLTAAPVVGGRLAPVVSAWAERYAPRPPGSTVPY